MESQGVPLLIKDLISKEKVFARETSAGKRIDVAIAPRMFASDGDTRVHENVKQAMATILEGYELVDPSQADLLVGERFGDPNHTVKWVGGQMRDHMTGSALKLSKRMQSFLTVNIRHLKKTLQEIEARVGVAALRSHPDTRKAIAKCVNHCLISVYHFIGEHSQCDPEVCAQMRVFQRLVESAESVEGTETADNDSDVEEVVADEVEDARAESALHDEFWIESCKITAENKGVGGVVSVHAASRDNVNVNQLLKIVKKNFTVDTVYLLARSISSQLVECLWSIVIQFTSGKRLCYDAKNRVGDFVGFSVMSLNLGWPEAIKRVLAAVNLPDTAVAKFAREARHKLKQQSADRKRTELYKKKRSASQQIAAELAAAVRLTADAYGNAENGVSKVKAPRKKRDRAVVDTHVASLEKARKLALRSRANTRRLDGAQTLADATAADLEADNLVMSISLAAE
jgi:hypothetical protein